jgi:cation transport ATPase
VVTEPGSGVWGMVGGTRTFVGKLEWVVSKVGNGRGPATPSDGAAGSDGSGSHSQHSEAATEVWVGAEGSGLLGVITARDAVRPDAAAVVRALHDRGLRCLVGRIAED